MHNKNYKTLSFPSKDGLEITADFYAVKNPKGLILLCHRSHCNRAEYRETAPKFNELGYSCLAIDQRSGMKVFGETNKTKERAKDKGLSTGYLDAKPDIEAAVDYAFEINKQNPIILVGSSYSASLSLMIATENKKIKSVIVFSPGEYLKRVNLANRIKDISIPIFATSAKKEIKQVSDVLKFVNDKYVTQFKPKVEGFHGSKTLWTEVSGSEYYWNALKKFLSNLEKE